MGRCGSALQPRDGGSLAGTPLVAEGTLESGHPLISAETVQGGGNRYGVGDTAGARHEKSEAKETRKDPLSEFPRSVYSQKRSSASDTENGSD